MHANGIEMHTHNCSPHCGWRLIVERHVCIRPCSQVTVVTALVGTGRRRRARKEAARTSKLGKDERCPEVPSFVVVVGLQVPGTHKSVTCGSSTYDRWLEELVAAGRLPGDIAEEMNGGLNTGGCVPEKTLPGGW